MEATSRQHGWRPLQGSNALMLLTSSLTLASNLASSNLPRIARSPPSQFLSQNLQNHKYRVNFPRIRFAEECSSDPSDGSIEWALNNLLLFVNVKYLVINTVNSSLLGNISVGVSLSAKVAGVSLLNRLWYFKSCDAVGRRGRGSL